MVTFFSIVSPASAQIVEDVEVRSRTTGYQIRFNFFLPLRYQSHSPRKKGDILLIQLRPLSSLGFDDPDLLNQLAEREILSWDKSIPVPIKEMTYEGDSPDRPTLTLRFNEEVEFDVRSSGDFRSLIVTLLIEKKAEEEKAFVKQEIPDPGITDVDPKIAKIFEEAKAEMEKENYRRAIQLYTKILNKPDTSLHQNAQELLGLARHRNGQLAHAKSEYDKYLQKYPEGAGAERVRQRLAGLLTATAQPKGKLRKTKKPGIPGETVWNSEIYGSLSMFYSRDETFRENGEDTVNRSDVTADLDFNARLRSDRFDLRTQFVGSDEVDFRKGGSGNETRISTLSFEAKDFKTGLYGRVGRQSRSSGGVLGRFDGALFSYDLTQKVKVNTVLGYPVRSSNSNAVDTDRKFYGVNFDLGTFFEHWDFNTFFIDQYVNGITDRRAVGGEVRFLHPKFSFFNLVDYDVSYNELNLFLVNAHYSLPTKTRLSMVLDYRKSPILTSSNALQGQGVEEVSDLLNIFSEEEVRQLAMDRTAKSRSGTLGVTQDLNENYQLSFEVTASKLSGTPASPASGGVDATPETGTDLFYSTQLIGTNLFTEGDVTILGLRYFDTDSNDSYSLIANTRFSVTRDFRINPRVQLEYRKNKTSDGDRFKIRPLLRLSYRWKKWLRLEFEGGMEWNKETTLGEVDRSRGYFISTGFRANF
jgi:tetratricopeptide (TPR) repeat protein